MRLDVRLFAVCRERVGRDHVSVELSGPDDDARVRDVLAALAEQEAGLSPLLASVRVAVNHAFVGEDAPVRDGDEVALIPPVSGGSGVVLAEIRDSPLELAEVHEAVASPDAGAICSFTGTVRDHTGEHRVQALDYEAYRDMAEKTLRSIGAEVCERLPRARVGILHRVGHLEVGEASVVIAVSAPHRGDAFEGCRQVIERLKEDAPIWKKELRTDGSVWVGMGS